MVLPEHVGSWPSAQSDPAWLSPLLFMGLEVSAPFIHEKAQTSLSRSVGNLQGRQLYRISVSWLGSVVWV